MFEVYLDEAGYTGGDLLNREQPVYALAGITLSNEISRDLVGRCFPGVKAKELKHSTIVRRARGREQILGFLDALAQHPDSASVTVAHKEGVLLGQLVDTWVETALYLQGFNLYERGGNIALLNVTYITLGVLLGADGRREFLRRFQVMMRDRTVFSYESFWGMVHRVRALAEGDQHLESLFDMYVVAEARLGIRHLWELPEHMLDLGDYGLLETANHWRGKTTEPLLLTHDHVKALVRKKEMWDTLLSADVPPAIVGLDRRVTRFPLNASVVLAESSLHLQLQLADILAGAFATLGSAGAGRSPNHPEYVDALRKSPLRQHLIGGVWPTSDVTPSDLGTEGPVHGDAADFMAAVLARAERKKDAE